jgi:hypothetical protein
VWTGFIWLRTGFVGGGGCCVCWEYDNELSGSIKGEEFLDLLMDYCSSRITVGDQQLESSLILRKKATVGCKHEFSVLCL